MHNSSRLLSIITVNRNNCAGLEATLASLRPLRCDPQLEFIGIDGLSSDGSSHLASHFYDPSLYRSEPDSGVYDAMNKGLALASGHYCYWLNSGDTFLADCWPRLRALLERYDCPLMACGVQQVGLSGDDLVAKFASPAQLPHSSLNHQSLFFHTATLKRLGGYRLRFGLTADRELVLRLLASGGAIHYEPLLVARYQLGGLSSDPVRLHRDHLRVSHAHGLISTPRYALSLLRHRFGRLWRSARRSAF
jgi:putative colanic acid biosynthesis glycosyltransferase